MDLKTEKKPHLLLFSWSLFPGKVEANSSFLGEIICAASGRSKDKEHKRCWFQWELSRHHFPKCSWCQPWLPNLLLSIPTSQPQNSTKTAQQIPSQPPVGHQAPDLSQENQEYFGVKLGTPNCPLLCLCLPFLKDFFRANSVNLPSVPESKSYITTHGNVSSQDVKTLVLLYHLWPLPSCFPP